MGKMIGDIPLDKLETQEFLSIEEVSKMFNLSRRTISKLIATQDLRVVKWGKEKRVPVTSVLYYLTRQGILFAGEMSDNYGRMFMLVRRECLMLGFHLLMLWRLL